MLRQDLNSSVMTGSKRIVNHTTFHELDWKRDPFAARTFILPQGFQKISYLLNEEFIELLEDIHALQCIRESTHLRASESPSTLHIDNHQASIQSRLANSTSFCSPLLNCCRLAAYLCSVMLRCKIWQNSVIPVSHLLRHVIWSFVSLQSCCYTPDLVPWPFVSLA